MPRELSHNEIENIKSRIKPWESNTVELTVDEIEGLLHELEDKVAELEDEINN